MKIAATRPIAVNNQRCQPALVDRKLKAAPLLNSSVRSKKPRTTSVRCPYENNRTIAIFVSWSAATTNTMRMSHGTMPSRLEREALRMRTIRRGV